MTKRGIYLKVAILIERNQEHFICNALEANIGGKDGFACSKEFKSLFHPRKDLKDRGDMWRLGFWGTDENARNCRVLAACFMAAIAARH